MMRSTSLDLLSTALLLTTWTGTRSAQLRASPPSVPSDTERTVIQQQGPGRLPAIPKVHGPLEIRIVYPSPSDVVAAEDTSFLFGSVGDGDATLTVNGRSVPVAPNGAFLAWLPFPRDSVARFEFVARTKSDEARLEYRVKRQLPFTGPAGKPWIDPGSLAPRGSVVWPRGEYLGFSLRAAPGARVELVLPSGARAPLSRREGPELASEALRAFDRDTLNLRRPARGDRYAGIIRGVASGVVAEKPDSYRPGNLSVEAIIGRDTARARWPVAIQLLDTLPVMAELDDDLEHKGNTDRITVGRPDPGATYHWFFPAGTVAEVSGRINGELRLRLSNTSAAWVAAAETKAVGQPAASLPATVGSVTMTPRKDLIAIRIPVTRRVPFQVTESPRALRLTLYRAAADIDWWRYGPADSLIGLAAWRQTTSDELEITIDLTEDVWGYRTRWDRNDLMVEIRRPPVIDRAEPLRGRTIVIDPGHPPIGATGPTGLRESEMTLAVAQRLVPLLRAKGATVLLTRTDHSPVELWSRVRFADSVGADLMVSIHGNAMPDGVNPFSNNGTSTFYFNPASFALARTLDDRLVAHFGTRDLGVSRANLALARPTWMPAVLTEGLFLMIPEQEAALRSPEGQLSYAQALFEGIERFLAEKARQR
ncbi:MAG: N-acetylmuramoyl-L-alanine amidase [Gemmatimonadota bacterium]